MKTRWRRLLLSLILVSALVLGLLFVANRIVTPPPPGAPPAPPQAIGTPPALGRLAVLVIDRTDAVSDGKMWVTLANDAQFQTTSYRIDLESGALDYKGDPPLIFDPKQGLALWSRVVTADPRRVYTGRWSLLNTLVRALYPPSDPRRVSVDYWALSGMGGAPDFIGRLPAKLHADIANWVSPNDDYCRVLNIGVGQYMVDLRHARLAAMPACDTSAREGGWWSDHEFAYFDRGENLMLYDARNGKASPLILSRQIAEFAGREGIDYRPGQMVHLRTARGGDRIAFILRGFPTGAGGGWLASIDRASKTLRLLARSFPSAQVGEFSADEAKFLYGGQKREVDSNAVYIHDIATSKTTALVPPRAGDLAYSQPRFVNDRIVYVQHTAIWSMKLDGSDARQVFPPAAAGN